MEMCIIKRILLSNYEGIGNFIMNTPAFRAIQTLYPTAIFDIHINPKRGTEFFAEPFGNLYHRITPYSNYDLGVFFFGKHGIKANIKREILLSFPGRHAFKIHEVEHYMLVARKLGYKGETPSMYVPNVITGYLNGIRGKKICISIGYLKSANKWYKKHFGNANYIKLIKNLLTNNPDYHIILVGDYLDEATDGRIITKACNHLSNYHTFCGRFSAIKETVGLINECDLMISNDSGLCHVASALDKPTIALFTPFTNPIKNKPFNKDGHALMLPSIEEIVILAKKYLL